jgi:glycosyltransferase involved in cell wall biosynthesis
VALLERLPAGGALARAMIRAGVAFTFASANLRARFAALVGPALADRVLAAAIAPAESALVRHPARRLARGEREAERGRRGLVGPLVLGVGRLVPVKGYDRLVRAVSRLAPAARPTLVILGEGSERARLEAMAEARGVRLYLPGLVGPDEVRRWLGLADLFVHPARILPGGRTEGTPVSVREALAAEVPVLATAGGGLDELAATHGAGFDLVKAGREGEVVAALGAALGRALCSLW